MVNVKDAKLDSSFFSSAKPKPKLPTFKKAQGPIVGSSSGMEVAGRSSDADLEMDEGGASSKGSYPQPIGLDPFQEALRAMSRNRKDSPSVQLQLRDGSSATPEPLGVVKSEDVLTARGTKRKSVTWAPDGQLERVKFIDKAIYDDDGPGDVSRFVFFE